MLHDVVHARELALRDVAPAKHSMVWFYEYGAPRKGLRPAKAPRI